MNWLAAGRAAFGFAVLAAPDTLGRRVAGVRFTTQTRWAVRILGARQLLQAVVCAPAPTRCVVELEAVVDGVHALTMAAVALVARRGSTRRAAAVSTASAVGFVLADVVSARSIKATEPQQNSALLARDRLAQAICGALPVPCGG